MAIPILSLDCPFVCELQMGTESEVGSLLANPSQRQAMFSIMNSGICRFYCKHLCSTCISVDGVGQQGKALTLNEMRMVMPLKAPIRPKIAMSRIQIGHLLCLLTICLQCMARSKAENDCAIDIGKRKSLAIWGPFHEMT